MLSGCYGGYCLCYHLCDVCEVDHDWLSVSRTGYKYKKIYLQNDPLNDISRISYSFIYLGNIMGSSISRYLAVVSLTATLISAPFYAMAEEIENQDVSS